MDAWVERDDSDGIVDGVRVSAEDGEILSGDGERSSSGRLGFDGGERFSSG